MNEQELQQAYTRHCEVTGQTKMTRTGFEDFKAGFRLGQPAAGEPVAWQWRSRIKGGAWDAWENGRYDFQPAPFMDVEHRALYAAPPAAAHGDEAVKPSLWARLDRAGFIVDWTEDPGRAEDWIEQNRKVRAYAAMRAQAGEGGEV